jgi:hypothetical protein
MDPEASMDALVPVASVDHPEASVDALVSVASVDALVPVASVDALVPVSFSAVPLNLFMWVFYSNNSAKIFFYNIKIIHTF